MKRAVCYLGYRTEIEWSEEDKLYYGKIEDITDLVCFEGKTIEEARENFKTAVDDYIEFCEGVKK